MGVDFGVELVFDGCDDVVMVGVVFGVGVGDY